jgi:predicted glycosyltransferase
MGHPAHVHFFKNTIKNLQEDGHVVKITARNKEVTLALLKAYGLDYEDRGEMYTGMLNKGLGMIRIDLKLLQIARSFRPDILIGVHNPYVAHVGAVIRKPVIIFTDTENVRIASLLTYPFVQTILTPAYFREAVDPGKHVPIRGMKEIAYLHPKYFSPDRC